MEPSIKKPQVLVTKWTVWFIAILTASILSAVAVLAYSWAIWLSDSWIFHRPTSDEEKIYNAAGN
ncbi:hypothetical protein BH09VER1_BH09VER1_23900 [soil metagenome]